MLTVVENWFKTLVPKQRLIVAYSGGRDSHVLLHKCYALATKYDINLCAWHVDHNISKNSCGWVRHCQDVCYKLGVEFKSYNIKIDSTTNIEAIAREKRYAIFAENLNPGDIIVTAHHKRDQAETLLMRLMRSSGIKGLKSIHAKRKIGKGMLERPMLNCNYDEICQYANMHSLNYIHDESNDNTDLSRNWLRHQVMPLLRSKSPQLDDIFAKSSTIAANTHAVLSDYLDRDLQLLTDNLYQLNWRKLLQFEPNKQKFLLRHWLDRNNIFVTNDRLDEFWRAVQMAGSDKSPILELGAYSLRRYRDYIFVVANDDIMPPHSVRWALQDKLAVNSQCWLAVPEIGKGISINKVGDTLESRFDVKDHITINNCTKSLKKCFQEWGVPPWRRSNLPILFHGAELVAVGGYWVKDSYRARGEDSGWVIKLSDF